MACTPISWVRVAPATMGSSLRAATTESLRVRVRFGTTSSPSELFTRSIVSPSPFVRPPVRRRRDLLALVGFGCAFAVVGAAYVYAKATPSFRATAALGVATLGLVALVTLWATGRVRWAVASPSRVVGLCLFVGVGGYLVYDLWWMKSMYQVWWWDHVTHTVSAMLIGTVGYTVVRAHEVRKTVRADGGRRAGPSRRVFVATVGVIVACALLWETYEVYAPMVTVYGTEDTVKDLLFNLLGAAVVVLFGERFLEGPARDVAERW